MPNLIESPSAIRCVGTVPKIIEEFVGRANTGETRLSIAHMKSPGGWTEPGQRPEFDEFTLVIRGCLVVEHESGTIEVPAGKAIHCKPGEWVRYSTPSADGAEYVAVCLPAFSPDTVHRDSE